MSDNKNQPKADGDSDMSQKLAELQKIVAQQGQQLSESLATTKILQSLLTEKLEAKMEPPAQDYLRKQDALHVEWQKKQDEFLEAQRKAAEAGDFKFMVGIFSSLEGNHQLGHAKGAHKTLPWEAGVNPTHPWRLIGVDAPDVETARLKATAKYNKVQGIRHVGDNLTHTIYQIGADGKPCNVEEDRQIFINQLSDVQAIAA